jgi:hypothetical protein
MRAAARESIARPKARSTTFDNSLIVDEYAALNICQAM